MISAPWMSRGRPLALSRAFAALWFCGFAPPSMTPRRDEAAPLESWRDRVREILLGSISLAAQEEYRAALLAFRGRCLDDDVAFDDLDQAQQDSVGANYMLDGYEHDEARHRYADRLSVLAKADPRRWLRVSYLVLDLCVGTM